MSTFSLADLDAIVATRLSATAENSYTRTLIDRGAGYCARKFGEEAVETLVAALSGSDEELTGEAADVLYHLLVLLRVRGVALPAVMAELERRTGQSGHAEKAARGTPVP